MMIDYLRLLRHTTRVMDLHHSLAESSEISLPVSCNVSVASLPPLQKNLRSVSLKQIHKLLLCCWLKSRGRKSMQYCTRHTKMHPESPAYLPANCAHSSKTMWTSLSLVTRTCPNQNIDPVYGHQKLLDLMVSALRLFGGPALSHLRSDTNIDVRYQLHLQLFSRKSLRVVQYHNVPSLQMQ